MPVMTLYGQASQVTLAVVAIWLVIIWKGLYPRNVIKKIIKIQPYLNEAILNDLIFLLTVNLNYLK